LVNVIPSALDCHCTVEAGLLEAVDANATAPFKQVVALFGCAVMVGDVLIVMMALPEDVPMQRESDKLVTV
jgi:hypothetical protein